MYRCAGSRVMNCYLESHVKWLWPIWMYFSSLWLKDLNTITLRWQGLRQILCAQQAELFGWRVSSSEGGVGLRQAASGPSAQPWMIDDDECWALGRMSGRANRSTWIKPTPAPFLSTTIPTWSDPGSNPVRRGGKPATNRLSCGTINSLVTKPWPPGFKQKMGQVAVKWEPRAHGCFVCGYGACRLQCVPRPLDSMSSQVCHNQLPSDNGKLGKQTNNYNCKETAQREVIR
jgi:hypothetical protein